MKINKRETKLKLSLFLRDYLSVAGLVVCLRSFSPAPIKQLLVALVIEVPAVFVIDLVIRFFRK